MVGQIYCVDKLKPIAPVRTLYGWQKDKNLTRQIRKYSELEKVKDKKAQIPETHAVDGIALAASEFIPYGVTPRKNCDTWGWKGSFNLTSRIFRGISRPAYFRRPLHFDNAEKGGTRKRKGGTITPFNFRYGDKVIADKAGKIYIGWVGGFTNAKTKNISL